MRKTALLVMFFIMVLSHTVNYIDEFGTFNRGFSARSVALSDSDLIETIFDSILVNPSAIGFRQNYYFAVSLPLSILSEDRAFPAYSFFDNLIGYQSYVENSNLFFDYAFVLSRGMRLNDDLKLTVALSKLPLIDFKYAYYEEIRDLSNPEPNRLAVNTIDRNGILDTFNISFGLNISKSISAGYTMGFIGGNYSNIKQVSLTAYGEALNPNPDPSMIEETKYKFKGNVNIMSFTLNLKRIAVSLSYRSFTSIGKEYSYYFKKGSEEDEGELNDFQFMLPSSLIFGLVYRPRSGIFSQIYLNYTNTQWSALKNESVEHGFTDTNDLSIGVEHNFDSGAIFRYGLFYKQHYSYDLVETGFSIGTGYRYKDFLDFDFGIQYIPLRYEAEDSFPDGDYSGLISGAVDRSSPDRIIQSRIKLGFSIGVSIK